MINKNPYQWTLEEKFKFHSENYNKILKSINIVNKCMTKNLFTFGADERPQIDHNFLKTLEKEIIKVKNEIDKIIITLDDLNYEKKYLKYKSKYNNLKKMI